MTKIRLTDEQETQRQANGLIVVDGERENDGWSPVFGASPELWRELANPCRRCGGAGEGYKVVGDRCPDCAGGHQVVEPVATCPNCRDWVGLIEQCPVCHGEGVVPVGRFTIRILPIVAARRGYWETKNEGDAWVALTVEREATGYLDQLVYGSTIPPRAIMFKLVGGILDRTDLTLDPLPHVGQFAVKFEPVPE